MPSHPIAQYLMMGGIILLAIGVVFGLAILLLVRGHRDAAAHDGAIPRPKRDDAP